MKGIGKGNDRSHLGSECECPTKELGCMCVSEKATFSEQRSHLIIRKGQQVQVWRMDRSSFNLEAVNQLGAAEVSGQEIRALTKTTEVITEAPHAKTLESLLHACSYMASSVPAGRSVQVNISLGPLSPKALCRRGPAPPGTPLQTHLGFFRW